MAINLDLFPEDPAPKAKRAVKAKSKRAYRTISEASEDVGVATHVLRFWETKFKEIKPTKREGGRRYYSAQDVDTLKRIRRLLHDEGYTIKGVQAYLKRQTNKEDTKPEGISSGFLKQALGELRAIQDVLKRA